MGTNTHSQTCGVGGSSEDCATWELQGKKTRERLANEVNIK